MMLSNGKVAKMPDKLTDSEIVKALEDWIKNYDGSYVNFKMLGNALGLINRQKAEIKRLKGQNKILKRDNHFNESGLFNLLYGALVFTKTFDDYKKFRNDFKTEAYKEFAERLKKALYSDSCRLVFDSDLDIFECAIDNLLKELVGEDNATQ